MAAVDRLSFVKGVLHVVLYAAGFILAVEFDTSFVFGFPRLTPRYTCGLCEYFRVLCLLQHLFAFLL